MQPTHDRDEKQCDRDLGVMLHLVRTTADGSELRSRYIFDRGKTCSTDEERAEALGFAYEMLLHDQTEFTHLSTFLASIHQEFGNQG
ncbi:DAPG hydrolase family protein [Streptomyces sp. NPDC056255]|uniref:DAPG hydrolase family protein n=1 Tax=Streptomyces sp. NPDC056255 TaxID=3345764 RepID=UPI0035DDE90B